jgi:hypothetical protein
MPLDSPAHDGTAYALNGEITFDQIARLEALVSAARKRGRTLTFDLPDRALSGMREACGKDGGL